jgi:hypothetical protein
MIDMVTDLASVLLLVISSLRVTKMPQVDGG